MNILLTGKPGIGKSTALRKIVDMLGRKRCCGILTEEILKDGERIGFRSHGIQSKKSVVLAHKEIDTGYYVEDFGVDLQPLDDLCEEEFRYVTGKIRFIILDEIGRMQMMSENFVGWLEKLGNGSRTLIASICLEDEIPYIRDFKKREENRLYVLDASNRERIPWEVCRTVNADDETYLGKLELARQYRSEIERYTFEENRIILRSTHGTRTITRDEEAYHCTCEYYQENGVCSHILSLLIEEGKE